MDPIQVEAQLRNTFLALLGSDMTVYEGTKQQYIMRFNNESRTIATGMIAQAQQRNAPINSADYQSVSMDLLNRYKQSMPQQQTYAMPMAPQPMPYAAPMYPPQPPVYAPQPYGVPVAQPMYRPVAPFNNLRYTPQQYAAPVQQPMYAPMQPTLSQPIQTGKSLYDGALPSNAAPTAPVAMAAPQVPPMTAVQRPANPPMVAPDAPPLIQPTVSTYTIPTIKERHMFFEKVPHPIKGETVTYMKDNGELINAVVAGTTAMLPDVDATVKALAKKKNAVDVTLKYTPYVLIAGDLAEMQKSFIDVKKIISDSRKELQKANEIVTKIVEYCDTKTKGVAKQIEGIILDIYNSYVAVANTDPDKTVVTPDADELECLQVPGTASAERYLDMALTEFEQYSIYDPSSVTLAGYLKEIDLGGDESYTDLKRSKTKFAEWAKSHCVLKKPVEIYRYSTVEHEGTDINQGFGFSDATPPDNALEFFTMESIAREQVRVVSMVVQDGKTCIESTGTVDRSNGVHVEFD